MIQPSDEAWLRVTLSSIGDAVVTTDIEAKVTFLNPVAESLTGWTLADAYGEPLEAVFRIINQETRNTVKSPTVRALRDGVIVGLANHTLLIAKDGTERPIDDSAASIRNDKGEIAGVVLVFRDITERHQQEQLIQDTLNYANNIISTLREPFVVLDSDLRVQSANQTFYENFHVTPEETQGRKVFDLGNGQWDIPGLRKLLNEILSDHHPVFNYEVEHDFQAIGKRFMLLNAVRIRKPGNDSNLILLAIEDITERIRMERKTKEQAETLADLNRRKDEFLAMLSHELRNPLAPIVNAVQLLRLQQDADQVHQTACTIIERQVGQLTRLVDDLMEVSRITTGRIHLHEEQLALNGVVKNAVETVRPLIGKHGHELNVALPPHPIWLFGDATKLEQVVVNLLTNAAKYTDKGGQILISVEQEGDEAVLRVRDSGSGIAPELLPRVFELFTQAKRSVDRSEGGLGIGLCLVKRLVEMHRGRVEAHSSLGKGSEFVVRLPVVHNVASSPTPVVETTNQTEASLRVLVVDDGRDVTQTFSMLLRKYGHDVRTAADGPTALESAIDYQPHVVLLDIGLPGMDGLEVARRLRQQPTLKNAVLVAMTGYGQESDRQRSLEAGFDHHLVKPADIRKVQEILASVKAT